MTKTLQKKFIKTAMVAITVLLVVFVSAINVVNVITVDRDYDRTLEVLTEMVGMKQPEFNQLEPRPDGFRKFFSPVLDEERVEMSHYFVAEINDDGSVANINLEKIPTITYEEAEELVAQTLGQSVLTGKVENFKYSYVFSPEAENARIVFVDTSANFRQVLTVAIISVGVGVVCWLAMLLFVSLLSKKAIKPIAENIEMQRQFITDAGHEIKTPLAIILANTDALELHNGESKWSKNIRNQTVRLNGLMQNLLTLSRSDESKKMLVKEEQRADLLLKELVEDFSTLAEAQGKKIRTEIGEGITLTAHRESLIQLFSVLIDNAVKYSADSTEISVILKKENNKTVFVTENTCNGLPECEPHKLFDRFYRADEARTQKSGGYGIGLSVARAIVEAHGGKIEAEYYVGNVMRFTVKL